MHFIIYNGAVKYKSYHNLILSKFQKLNAHKYFNKFNVENKLKTFSVKRQLTVQIEILIVVLKLKRRK